MLPKFTPRLEALERRDVPSAISFFQTDDAAFVPRMAVLNDPNPVTLGLQFQVQPERLGPVNGTITAIQFYRGAAGDGPFTVDLWDAAGNLLGSGTEAGNQSPGWQTVNLTQPVPVQNGVNYVASYYAPDGGYAADQYYFGRFDGSHPEGHGASIDSGSLFANASLYSYGSGPLFPTNTYKNNNYWVGPVFTPDTDSSPVITSLSKTSGSTFGPDPSSTRDLITISVTNVDFNNSRLTVFFGDQKVGIVSVDRASSTILVYAGTHSAGTVNVRVVTDGGESASSAATQFTYAPQPLDTAFGLFDLNNPDPSSVPTIPAANDSAAVELGIQFQVKAAETIVAIQVYRAESSGDGYTVHLAKADGTQLAAGLAAPQQAPGWQIAYLDHPVPVFSFSNSPNIYVASYFAPHGGYADSQNFFTNGPLDRGPIVGLQGVYHYGPGGGFPNATYNNSNYWVSPVFAPGSDGNPQRSDSSLAPAITSISQSSGSTSGGGFLTIIGNNFNLGNSGDLAVFFGSVRAMVTVIDAQTLHVTIPAHIAGTIHIRVISDEGESALTMADLFTFV
ncbi:MAG TPA: DUF4082 domain-containing protein [Gemmataceae bacterium]|nr:DUF4082 domain-containing protein [Gemmataceae bacterium]